MNPPKKQKKQINADLTKVIASYIRASAKIYHQEPISDPIKSLPSIVIDSPLLKSKLADQIIKEKGSGKRIDRIKNDMKNLRAIHMRKVWIVENWVSFIPIHEEITKAHEDSLGLCYFTDETISDLVQSTFPELGDFTKKQFEDFRKRYGLVQVSLEHRQSGVVINGVLNVTRIGRKKA